MQTTSDQAVPNRNRISVKIFAHEPEIKVEEEAKQLGMTSDLYHFLPLLTF